MGSRSPTHWRERRGDVDDLDADPTTWTVHTLWWPTPNESAVEPDTKQTYPDWPEARKDALKLTCLAGTRAVKVLDPWGDVYAHWDYWSNRWHEPR